MVNEVILTSNVKGLGFTGDVVKVADGYARNYLLPKKLAAPVTKANRLQVEKAKQEREAQSNERLEEAKALAIVIEKASCTIAVKTADEGQMYGSVAAAQIVDALAEQGIKVQKEQVILDKPIRELGVFEVTMQVHPEIKTALKLWVVEE